MKKIKKLLTSPIFILIALVLISCFVLPLISSWLHVSVAHRILYLFLVIDSLVALSISWMIRHWQLSFLWLFLFPVMFAISVWWRLAKYNYWLAGLYLILSLIGYLLLAPQNHQARA
ncbi:hypothetical protein FC15_GL001627 [Lapidilactobacillus concavus DSM 17758]|uniref:Integral membrane protein n=1 Tax=Lapidilactobacillus concavus DSM 17758 TaxID=1423735 RepID=A0A0R1VV88_9LACO|nr:hypothetical protein [Lapidilactobacillus concavus]KRM09681.1 hypothetical protein FC15_GL001627 [Lapidilactobacillus concavus DSM 17758]GEL14056.1 hypothetical protein LCO01nite_16050 [Lapidilactobacillus concavus]